MNGEERLTSRDLAGFDAKGIIAIETYIRRNPRQRELLPALEVLAR